MTQSGNRVILYRSCPSFLYEKKTDLGQAYASRVVRSVGGKIVYTIPQNSAHLKLASVARTVTARGLETMKMNNSEITYNGIGRGYANAGLTLVVGV